jgi:hypothetical protein
VECASENADIARSRDELNLSQSLVIRHPTAADLEVSDYQAAAQRAIEIASHLPEGCAEDTQLLLAVRGSHARRPAAQHRALSPQWSRTGAQICK